MRLVTLYNHGVTMGTPPKNPNRNPVKRGDVQGWTKAATRRNTNFLRSVDDHAIMVTEDGEPLTALALTLTLKDCPESHNEWERLRRAMLKRLERLGLYRHHWVTEWQRRGVPHLHGCVFFPEVEGQDYWNLVNNILDAWLSLTEKYGSKVLSQNITPVYDAVGWFQYQSKHAARGIFHYQRSSENIPEAWKKTGRMWGKSEKWPVTEPDKILVTDKIFFSYRRLVKSWRKADARKEKNRFRIRKARRMLKHNDRELSKLTGVSEWITKSSSVLMLKIVMEMYSSQPEEQAHLKSSEDT